MNKRIIKSDKIPTPIGPYNQAVAVGNLLYLSGQIPLDPSTNTIVPGGVVEQTHQVLKNISSILSAAGTSLENVVKATVFLKNMQDFAEMNKVYAEYIKAEWAPARSTIEVARLPKDALVEIEVVAAL